MFLGLRPPAPVRDALLAAQCGVDGARWQDEDQLHLTLRFIGEIDHRGADDLGAALGSVMGDAFDLAIRGAGHFERKGRPSALWAAIAPSDGLLTLHRRVASACRAAGVPPDSKSFVPHVTLARLGGHSTGAGEWLARHGALSAPPWPVTSFRLYESTLAPTGSRYTTLAKWPLARRTADSG
nr:RNA 2',3'-cyclic phosphodiesterase [Tsuneonella aeria]